MNIVFRADAAPHTGLGHLMRCLTLADNLRKRGMTTTFVSRHLSVHLRAIVVARGHALRLVESRDATGNGRPRGDLSHSHWLGASQETDARESLDALGGSVDWVVVDNYALDERWETAMRASARNVMAIDDMADRAHACDLLLDQNIFHDLDTRYDGLTPSGCRRLLGPRYSLLRPEFARLRARVSVRANVRRILVLLGGTDAGNETEKAILALVSLRRQVEIDVVIGADHPARARLAELCARHGFMLHVQVDNVGALMLRSDLAIGATGSASWERCCLGLPTICVTSADNQVPIAVGLAALGAIENLGDASCVTTAGIADLLASLMDDPERVERMSRAALALVDGRGTDRVSEAIATS